MWNLLGVVGTEVSARLVGQASSSARRVRRATVEQKVTIFGGRWNPGSPASQEIEPIWVSVLTPEAS